MTTSSHLTETNRDLPSRVAENRAPNLLFKRSFGSCCFGRGCLSSNSAPNELDDVETDYLRTSAKQRSDGPLHGERTASGPDRAAMRKIIWTDGGQVITKVNGQAG